MKSKYKNLLLFIGLFFLFFTFYRFKPSILSMDEVWNYGFAYNIRNGLIPYRDFNMILTPLYPYTLSLFILIFENNFIMEIIFNCLILAFISFILIKNIGKKGLFFIPILICIGSCCYNILSLLLFLIFLYINNSKYKDNQYLIGFIVSLMLLTKQTTGGLILIASFLFSKKKKDYLTGFLPLCIVFLSYLFFTNSLYNFFNYCLFGMFNFTTGNSFSGIDYTIILFIISFILLIYLLIKKQFKSQELIYIFLFQIIAFPLFDYSHIFISLLPFLSYLFELKNINKIIYKIRLYLVTFIVVMTLVVDIRTICIDSNMYSNNMSFLNRIFIYTNMDTLVYNLKEEIDNNYVDYTIYHINTLAYLYKLETNEKINKFDLSNKGNMGYNGEEKWIKEIDETCKNTKCLLILDHYKDINTQISMKINNYVIDNYKFEKNIDLYDLYTNKTDET